MSSHSVPCVLCAVQDAVKLVRSLNPFYSGYIGVTVGWFTSNSQQRLEWSYLDYMLNIFNASGLHKYLGMPPNDVRPIVAAVARFPLMIVLRCSFSAFPSAAAGLSNQLLLQLCCEPRTCPGESPGAVRAYL